MYKPRIKMSRKSDLFYVKIKESRFSKYQVYFKTNQKNAAINLKNSLEKSIENEIKNGVQEIKFLYGK